MRRPFDADAILRDLVRSGREGGRFDIRIDRHGDWHYQGSPIERTEIVRLFASILRRAEDGTHWLVTPVEQGRIEVEDVPFVLVELAIEEGSRGPVLRFRSNLDEWVEASADHPLVMRPPPGGGGSAPYLLVRNGLEGRIARPVFYELADLASEHDGRMGVWSNGAFHPLEEA